MPVPPIMYVLSHSLMFPQVLLRGCRCVEIDVWDGEPPSSSGSEDESANPEARKAKKEKKDLSFRKRLELRFGRKGSPPPEEKQKEPSQSPRKGATAEEHITPWKSNTSWRAEPRVLHGTCISHRTLSNSNGMSGYTLTKDTSFRAVCAMIRDYAFTTS